MDYAKGYFESSEFRELRKKYEQMKAQGVCSYFETDELSDLLSYYLYTNKMQEAEEVYNHAKKLHSGSTEIKKMEIKILLSCDKAYEALMLIETMDTSNDDDALMIKAEILLAMKEYKLSHNIAKSILKRKDANKDLIYDALEILLDCGCAQEALTITKERLKKNRNEKGLWEIKAECLIELQHTDRAIEIYNALLDEQPYSTFYWEQLGHIYYMIERYGKALECFEYELTINEEIEYARLMQAYCYYRLRVYKKSQEIFESFTKSYPDNMVARFYLALSLAAQGFTAEALNEYDYIINRTPDRLNGETMLALINSGIIYAKEGNNTKAEQCMTRAVNEYRARDSRQLLLNKKGFYELRDKENLTFDDMNQTESKDWYDHETLFACGRMLTREKLYTLAKKVLITATSLAGSNHDCTEIFAYTAYCSHMTGDNENFRKSVKKALDNKSDKLFELFGIPYDANMLPEKFFRIVQ